MRTFRVHAMQGRISPYMYPILQLHTACLHAFFFSWGTTPKARGASRAGEENEQRVHGGRLESARDDTSMKKRQSRFQSEARTVNDDMKQTTRDRRGSSPDSKD
jgi:hypothetical protein